MGSSQPSNALRRITWDKLIDEQRRQGDGSGTDQREIGGFQRRMQQQQVAEGDNDCQFSRASSSAIAATSSAPTGRRGSASNSRCNLRSAAQASFGGSARTRKINFQKLIRDH